MINVLGGKMKISIIVPIYNMEKHLEKCIDSILNQTYKNLEIILVNDGSKDNSGKICEEYIKLDRRVRVIHQENMGLSGARDSGIAISTGEYLQFVDPDDYVDTNITECFVNALLDSKSDLIISGYKKVFYYSQSENKTITASKHLQGKFSKVDFLKNFGELYNEMLINSTCNKLYSLKIIKEHGITSVLGLNRGQDLLFNLEYLKYCNKFHVIGEAYYYYVQYGLESLRATTKFKKDLLENQQLLYSYIRKFLTDHNSYSEENFTNVENSFFNTIIGCLDHMYHPDNTYNGRDRIKKIREIVNDKQVRISLDEFSPNNRQGRLVGLLVGHKRINLIALFFFIKSNIKNKSEKTFGLIRRWLK
jgi:glycosyltransferase involved in cell wall biosynthesis